MDIPLKSQPKVSVVNLLDESKFKVEEKTDGRNSSSHYRAFPDVKDAILGERNRAIDFERSPRSIEGHHPEKWGYKLARTYSETEANNFDDETGHRLFDDGKIRPKLSRASTAISEGPSSPSKIYSRSHNECMDTDDGKAFVGLEDEYIPGLDFNDIIYRWTKPSEINLAAFTERYEAASASTPTNPEANTPISEETSYLDLNLLHAKVAPQPIAQKSQSSSTSNAYLKFSDHLRTRLSQGGLSNLSGSTGSTRHTLGLAEVPRVSKKLKSLQVIDPTTGEINYELILDSLPPNFNELPYSQRRKLVKSFSESIDYSQFSLFAKQYLSQRSGPNSFRTPDTRRSNGSFTRRSRGDSTNTLVGKLLASSSSTDSRKLEARPKINVDEKGAYVLGYELGKVIGFGAWGTIRECYAPDSSIKAVKIVTSRKDYENDDNSKSASDHPRVLEVFRNEINVWKRLKHDNILPLIDHLETEHTIFCITDRISGGTLFELVSSWGLYCAQNPDVHLIDRQAQRLGDIKNFVTQIVNALMYMHQDLGIVHGDIKLENILVDNLDPNNLKMVLCDFGMSRTYSSRLSRKSSYKNYNEGILMMRSKSSNPSSRKPLIGSPTKHSRNLFQDDSKIGISNLFKHHGPSLQSVHLESDLSLTSLCSWQQKYQIKEETHAEGIESNLPHSHIGSLPYASPELLSPSPPPLGPSADVWALGVLLYTMCVGRLPFQHPYEPRLRAIITAGKYAKDDLEKACLMRWLFDTEGSDGDTNTSNNRELCSSTLDIKNEAQKEIIRSLHEEWTKRDCNTYKWLYEIVTGCLEIDITKRLDLDLLYESFKSH